MANCINGTIATEYGGSKPGQIKYFLMHSIKLNGQKVTHIFCAVNWYSEFIDDNYNAEKLSPSVIYRPCDKIPPGPAVFMPVQRINSVCAYSFRNISGYKNCIVAYPVKLNIYIETECIL